MTAGNDVALDLGGEDLNPETFAFEQHLPRGDVGDNVDPYTQRQVGGEAKYHSDKMGEVMDDAAENLEDSPTALLGKRASRVLSLTDRDGVTPIGATPPAPGVHHSMHRLILKELPSGELERQSSRGEDEEGDNDDGKASGGRKVTSGGSALNEGRCGGGGGGLFGGVDFGLVPAAAAVRMHQVPPALGRAGSSEELEEIDRSGGAPGGAGQARL